jgi:hypothetical protein
VGFVVHNNDLTPGDNEAAVWSYTLTGGALSVSSIADIDPALGNYQEFPLKRVPNRRSAGRSEEGEAG